MKKTRKKAKKKLQKNSATAGVVLRIIAGEQKPFVWVTHKGKSMSVRQMATEHLFYTIRMLYNHSVPPFLRVGEFVRYPDVSRWPIDYRRKASAAMFKEFNRRSDCERADIHEIDDMMANASVLRALERDTGLQRRDWEDTQH